MLPLAARSARAPALARNEEGVERARGSGKIRNRWLGMQRAWRRQDCPLLVLSQTAGTPGDVRSAGAASSAQADPGMCPQFRLARAAAVYRRRRPAASRRDEANSASRRATCSDNPAILGCVAVVCGFRCAEPSSADEQAPSASPVPPCRTFLARADGHGVQPAVCLRPRRARRGR